MAGGRFVLALGIVWVALAGAERAHALCAAPSGHGTPEGTKIPPRGVLYSFHGVRVAAEAYDAGDSLVYREFVVDPNWVAPVEAPRVVLAQRLTSSWTCASEDVLAIELDQPVAAVRVRWASQDERAEMIVPPTPWSSESGLPAAVLKLGDLACAGANLPLAILRRGVKLELTAIRHDGSEIAIEGVPSRVYLDQLPLMTRSSLVGFALAGAEPQGSPTPRKERRDHAIPLAMALGTVVLAGWRFSRRRRCAVP